MMKVYRIILLLSILPNLLFAQTIQILDKGERQGIENVSVYSSDGSVNEQTNQNGEVDFGAFRNADTINIQHPGYYQKKIVVGDLPQQRYQVKLTEKVVQLGEAIIMVNRWEQDKSEIPNKIVTVKPSEISFENPQTAADALESTGQVFVQKSQLGGGSPMIRGFGANSVLIVVDGVRMNNAIFRSGNLQNIISIDPAVIGEAEVVFGPGSVIYGSDALGGVMDFHTKKPVFATENGLNATGDAFVRYSSANNEKTGHVDFNLGGKKWSSLSSFTYSDFGDLRSGSWRPSRYPDFGKRFNYVVTGPTGDEVVANEDVNVQKFSGYNQWNLMEKVSYRPTEDLMLTYGFIFTNTSNIPRYDRLITYDEESGLPDNAQWYYGPQKWMMNYLKAEHFGENTLYDALKVTVAFQNFEESRNSRKFQNSKLRSQIEQVDAFTVNVDADKELHEGSKLFYGAELVHNDVNSTAFTQNINTGEIAATATRYPDGGSDYNTAAVYASHRWDINSQMVLNTGLRYSQVWLNSRFVDKSFYNFPFNEITLNTGSLNGSVGLVYHPTDEWQLSAMLSSGFRAPNIDDVGKVFDSEPGSVVVPNPDLSPETSYNAEIGIQKSFGEFVKMGGVVFYSRLQNAMVRRDFQFNGQDSIDYDGELSQVQALVNVGQAYIWGFSANIQVVLSDHWFAQSSLTYNTGKDAIEQIPLRHTIPMFGRTSLNYHQARFRGEFYARYNGKRSYDDLPPSEQGDIYLYTPEGALGWFTLNLKGSYQLNEMLEAQLGFENILDKHYRVYSSGISAPGRNIIISLRANF